MNERIKELEKRAFDAVWDLDNDPIGPGTHFRPDGFEQKFAELIVKECCKEIVYSSVGQEDPVFAYEYINHLRSKFGVEE